MNKNDLMRYIDVWQEGELFAWAIFEKGVGNPNHIQTPEVSDYRFRSKEAAIRQALWVIHNEYPNLVE